MKLIAIALIAIIAAGCNIFGGGGPGTIPDTTDAFKGTDGLVVSFFEEAPPEKAYPGGIINLGVLFENKGASAIPCLQICIRNRPGFGG